MIPKASPQGWLFIVLPTVLSFAILLGVGPILQQTLGSAFETQAPTLYETFYDDGIIPTISLSKWLLFGFDYYLLIPAILASFVALSADTYVKGAFRAALMAFVAISLADSIQFFVASEPIDIGQSVLFNAIGTIFVWLSFTLLFLLLEGCRSFDLAPLKFSYPILSIIGSAAISTVVFVLFQIFFSPSQSTQFQAIAAIPTSGFMVSDHRESGDEKNAKRRPLSAFPLDSLADSSSFTGSSGEVLAHWKNLDPDSKYMIRIRFYADCPHPSDLKKLPRAKPLIELSPKELSVRMSDGPIVFLTAHDGKRRYNLSTSMVSYYWFEDNDAGEIGEISSFISEGDSVEVEPDSALQFYLGGPLSKIENSSSRSEKRRITILIDGKLYVIDAGGERQTKGKPLRCAPINSGKIVPVEDGFGILITGGETLYSLGALIEIIDLHVPTDVYRLDRSRLELSHANGWIGIKGFDHERTTERDLGSGRGISINENLVRLIVDGQEINVSKTDTLVAVADVRVTREVNHIEADGNATALWLNNRRLNLTIWERSAESWQISFITAILALFGLTVRKFAPPLISFIRLGSAMNLRT